MARDQNKSEPNASLDAIRAAEESAEVIVDFAKRLKSHLSIAARKELEVGKGATVVFRKLLANLKKLPTVSPQVRTDDLAHLVEAALVKAEKSVREGLPRKLQEACNEASLEFKTLPEPLSFAIGPFAVVVQPESDSASLSYARSSLAERLPASAKDLVACALSLRQSVLEAPIQSSQFAAELIEAVRVTQARKASTANHIVNYVPSLAATYEEWSLIRQRRTESSRKRSPPGAESLGRFIVELTQFMRSDANLQSEQPFQLSFPWPLASNRREARGRV